MVFLGIACAASALWRSPSTQFYSTLFQNTVLNSQAMTSYIMAPQRRAMMCKQRVMMQKACYNFYLKKTSMEGKQCAMASYVNSVLWQSSEPLHTNSARWREPPHFTMCHYVLMEYATGVGHKDRAPHHKLLQAERICYGCGECRQRTSLHAITC